MSRWEMAVFLARVTATRRGETVPFYGLAQGAAYNCTSTAQPGYPAMISLFPDVPWNDGGCMYIHHIYAQGIT